MPPSNGVDATVVAIPFYFGSMEVERRYLRRRAMAEGPSPADYDRPDTVASLSMGVASLLAPFAAQALARRVTPGSGRWGRALVGTAVGAVVVTTVADRFAAHGTEIAGGAPHGSPARRSEKVQQWARRIARIGGPTALAAGTLAISTAWTARTSPGRQWRNGQRRDLGSGLVGWTAAIAGWDLIYYWNHRMMHEVRGLWAIHVVHHSSERYNLSTALRQPVADVFGAFVPYGLLSRLGVRPSLVAQARGLNLLYQYWIHTDSIRSIGPGEEVLNTPSHHRVHHGSNRRYLDRNHGSILIVWDRLFGTFQREEEPVTYGLTKNIHSYSPARIATHEYRDIIGDIAGSTTWRDRLSFVLRGPGWAYGRRGERVEVAAVEATGVS